MMEYLNTTKGLYQSSGVPIFHDEYALADRAQMIFTRRAHWTVANEPNIFVYRSKGPPVRNVHA